MFLSTIPIHRFLNPAISYDSCVGIPILLCFGTCLALCLNSFVLNVKALVGSFNQEKALVGAFSVIVKTDGSFAALYRQCFCQNAGNCALIRQDKTCHRLNNMQTLPAHIQTKQRHPVS